MAHVAYGQGGTSVVLNVGKIKQLQKIKVVRVDALGHQAYISNQIPYARALTLQTVSASSWFLDRKG